MVGEAVHVGGGRGAVLGLVTQSCPTLCNPMDCSPPGSSVHDNSAGKNTDVGCHAVLQIFPTKGLNPGVEPRGWTQAESTLQVDSLLSQPPGKPGGWGACNLCTFPLISY